VSALSSCVTPPSNARSARSSTRSRPSTTGASAGRRPSPTWTRNARGADRPGERTAIVVDASGLANALADDQAAGDAARGELRAADQVTAPDLVDVETVSVLRKRWLARTLIDQRFEAAVGHLQQLRFERVPTLRLMRHAFGLRAKR
jgi:predicted nucleic acid-binding protein